MCPDFKYFFYVLMNTSSSTVCPAMEQSTESDPLYVRLPSPYSSFEPWHIVVFPPPETYGYSHHFTRLNILIMSLLIFQSVFILLRTLLL